MVKAPMGPWTRCGVVAMRGMELPRPVYLLIHRDKHRTPAIRAFQALLPALPEAVDGPILRATP